MASTPFSATGKSFSIHEWRGSGPAILHVHHSDDEARHVLDGQLMFRYADRAQTAGPGTTQRTSVPVKIDALRPMMRSLTI